MAIVAQGAYSVDEYGGVAFSKAPNDRIRAASVVKFITAHLTLEWVADLSTVVTVIEDDMSAGSVAGLQPGDTITVDDLLYGLMLPSGNDAAKCLGRIVGGMMLAAEGGTGDPVARFVEEMNATTSAFGFPLFAIGSPSGSDSVSKCSPRELALTVKALWDAGSGSFAYAGTDTKTITVGGPNARQIPLQNTTERDGAVKFPEMIAAKTGLIAGIGNLVMVWEHPETGQTQFSAIMNTTPSTQRFVDMRTLMDEVIARSGDRLRVAGKRVLALHVGSAEVVAVKFGSASGSVQVWP